MSDKLNNLKLDLLLKELKLLDSEQNYYDEFTNHYRSVFMDELTKNGYIPQIQTGETKEEVFESKNNVDIDSEDLKLIKSTFRSIAKVSHPDKTKNTYKNKLYNQAQIAYDNNDLLTLYKIAKKLLIPVELSITTFSLLEKIIAFDMNIEFSYQLMVVR